MAEPKVSDLTVEQLVSLMRQIMREEMANRSRSSERVLPLDDFPVDDLGPWPDSLTLRREDSYGDDGR